MWEEEWEDEEPEEIVSLNDDLHLDFHSISAKQGHFGCSTQYIASERKVVHKRWGARRRFFDLLPPKAIRHEPEYLAVPQWITTEEQLLEYIDRERPGWYMSPHTRRKYRGGR